MRQFAAHRAVIEHRHEREIFGLNFCSVLKCALVDAYVCFFSSGTSNVISRPSRALNRWQQAR